MRRALIALIAFALASGSIGGATQAADKVYRIGFLVSTMSPGAIAMRDGVSSSLAQHGYLPGKNLIV